MLLNEAKQPAECSLRYFGNSPKETRVLLQLNQYPIVTRLKVPTVDLYLAEVILVLIELCHLYEHCLVLETWEGDWSVTETPHLPWFDMVVYCIDENVAETYSNL